MTSSRCKITNRFRPSNGSFESSPSPAGSKFRPIYQRANLPSGARRRVQTGQYDQYQMIQDERAAHEYSELIQKWLNGDPIATARLDAVLAQNEFTEQMNQINGMFPDLRTILDSQNTVREFYEMNGGKDHFGVDFQTFLNSYEFGTQEKASSDPAPADPAQQTILIEGGSPNGSEA